ncbi:arylamine N-acetyltransferase [Sphingomonas sp. BT-65]|uniref:arylamine N-acetyltransferase family protein n=1 Tax=Sphingomonas sp. BT-65 TaxID=2989821 RepID=UPI0022360BCC|nr:arylamine N-acetyltransferase [Sphingomonas sp. BT-65]MCW4462343.1 arylamine N-acetyltransferase [Sphingomonas sp. BT-65]
MTLRPADIDAYFARIGWSGPVAADRATLNAIALRHPAAIPFENLDPYLDRPVDLAAEVLMAKLVHGGRGGYCFEQNGLLRHMLEALGFAVTPLSGRVVWNMDPEAVTARTHMLLRVELAEGPVLIDSGFGAAVPTGVLDLIPDIEQPTPHEPFRFARNGEEWRAQIRIGSAWRTTYRFDLSPQHEIDYLVANWYTSTHPSSHFRHGLTLARPLAGRRVSLRGNEFALHPLGGASERRTLATPEEIVAVIEADFGIAIPDRPALLARLHRDLPALAAG